MDIARGLFKLAWRNNKKVKDELENHKRIKGLWRMNSMEEMEEFITLWDLGSFGRASSKMTSLVKPKPVKLKIVPSPDF